MEEPERDPLPMIAQTLGKLEERTAAIQEDVGEMKDNFKEHIEPNDSIHAKLDVRIGLLEKAWLMARGAGLALLFASPLFVLGIRESIADLFK
jgi:hypothetical protein